MTRQFTAKQRRVCDLILRLSWGCGKETAYIPHLADFEVVGLFRQDIFATLTLLQAENVIYWDREGHHFAFNKDFDQWKVSLHQTAVLKASLLADLIKTNVTRRHPPVSESLTQQLVNHLPPCKYITYTPSLESEAAKEKERKGNKISTTTGQQKMSKDFGEFCRVYKENIGMLSPLLAQELQLLFNDFSFEWFEEAVKEAVTWNKRSLQYISSILKRWSVEGFKAPMGRKTGMPTGRPQRPAQLPTGQELAESWGKSQQSGSGHG